MRRILVSAGALALFALPSVAVAGRCRGGAGVDICYTNWRGETAQATVSRRAARWFTRYGAWYVSAEADDGIDNDCDGWVDEDFVCPCFDTADLDYLIGDLSNYAYAWTSRANGTSDVLSLRGDEWFQDTDGVWKAPTIGADVYTVDAEGGAPYCSIWSETYQAAPYHDWAGDLVEDVQPIADESFSVCEGILSDWITDNGVPLSSW